MKFSTMFILTYASIIVKYTTYTIHMYLKKHKDINKADDTVIITFLACQWKMESCILGLLINTLHS